MNHNTPPRPHEHAEHALITAILHGEYPPGSTLPGERDLARQIGVTRPTLRETLRRLERDGWLTVQQGKATTVNDFWWDGGLNVLSGIVRYANGLPPDFVPNLLQVRLDLAPSYTRLAVARATGDVLAALDGHDTLDDAPQAWAAFDWTLQRSLTLASGNPVYALILNGFADFYPVLATRYFSLVTAREASGHYYTALAAAAQQGDSIRAAAITQAVMQESIALWRAASGPGETHS